MSKSDTAVNFQINILMIFTKNKTKIGNFAWNSDLLMCCKSLIFVRKKGTVGELPPSRNY